MDSIQHQHALRMMALSYLQEAQINAGIHASQQYDMKRESEKQPMSPPLNNNNSSGLFSGMSTAARAAGLSMLTPQQLIAASRTAALMAAGIPVSLHARLAATPSLYHHHHQTLFGGWPPQTASSQLIHAGPVSPALSNKSTSKRTSSATAINNNNNNNVVSSSADRISKKGQPAKRRASSKTKAQDTSQSLVLDGTAPPSPPASISPEVSKDSRDKVFTCGVCRRSFGYKHVLQNHERTHTGEKPFECPECHKRFTRDHHLKTHMRLHTGEKPYHCSHCDRQFVQVANLRRHLRVHTGERPYACEMCTAKFSDSNQLKAHLLIHKGEKPFECEHCQMRFRRRHHLMHHKCGTQRSHGASPSIASDDLEDDIDIDSIDVEMEERDSRVVGHTKQPPAPVRRQQQSQHRQLTSPAIDTSMPLNLSGSTNDLPEQTEPEDLSMTKVVTRRPHSHSHSSGDSPLSQSPSSDTLHEDNEDELDVSEASPSSLFLTQRHTDFNRHYLADLGPSQAS